MASCDGSQYPENIGWNEKFSLLRIFKSLLPLGAKARRILKPQKRPS